MYIGLPVDVLSAVGASSSVLSQLPMPFIAISAGTGILVAQYFGAKEKEKSGLKKVKLPSCQMQ